MPKNSLVVVNKVDAASRATVLTQLERASEFVPLFEKDAPRFKALVDDTLLDLEASGEAAKMFDAWFAPVRRPFRIQPD